MCRTESTRPRDGWGLFTVEQVPKIFRGYLGELIAFECVGLAAANAKDAELRMGGYRDVILSVVKASDATTGASLRDAALGKASGA
jgi:hypothetical protein